MTKSKEIVCIVCRKPYGQHSFNELVRCKLEVTMAHVSLLSKYNEISSERHEMEDK